MSDAVRKLADKIMFPDDTVQTTAGVISKPPSGFVKVTNIYLKEVDKEVILITEG